MNPISILSTHGLAGVDGWVGAGRGRPDLAGVAAATLTAVFAPLTSRLYRTRSALGRLATPSPGGLDGSAPAAGPNSARAGHPELAQEEAAVIAEVVQLAQLERELPARTYQLSAISRMRPRQQTRLIQPVAHLRDVIDHLGVEHAEEHGQDAGVEGGVGAGAGALDQRPANAGARRRARATGSQRAAHSQQ